MAILVNKIFRNGIEAKDAYAKIGNISGDKDLISFDLDYYFNQRARSNNKQSLETETYVLNYDTNSGCVFEQCYNYLKSLPKFEGCVDVLE